MAIRTLNTIFAKHHRVIFGIFTVIIIIAFVDFFTPGTGLTSLFGNRSSRTAGEVFGRSVSYNELFEQEQIDALGLWVFRNIPASRLPREYLEQQAFRTIASMEAAKELGIEVTDAEVGRFLRVMPVFCNAKGEFDAARYEDFVTTVLPQEGYSEKLLNQAARNARTEMKLAAAVAAGTVVTPGETEAFYNLLNEQLLVLAKEFKAADFKVTPDEAALVRYFDANQSSYVVPAQISATLAAFPYQDFAAEAAKAATDQAVKNFYDKNPALFSEVKAEKVTVKPFDAVKAEAKTQFIAARTKELALRRAQQFAQQVYEAVSAAPAEKTAVFARLVKENKLKSTSTGKIAANAKAIGKLEEPELVAELGRVYAEVPVSNAVAGKTAVYVGLVEEMIPARNGTLAEFRKQATADCSKAMAIEAARKSATDAVKALQALAPAERLAAAKKQLKAQPAFTRMAPPKEQPLLMAAVDLACGEVVPQPLYTEDGAIVIFMLERKAPKEPFKADQSQTYAAYCREFKSSQAEAALSAYLAANCRRAVEEKTPEAAK